MVRRLRRKRLVRPANQGRQLLHSNQERAVDFACDALGTGRAIRLLAIVDAFTRECLTLEVHTSFIEPACSSCSRASHRAQRHARIDSL